MGDLYTDPQIHTVKGTDFGDGNLGSWGKPGLSTETIYPSLKSPSSLYSQQKQGKSAYEPCQGGGNGILGRWDPTSPLFSAVYICPCHKAEPHP